MTKCFMSTDSFGTGPCTPPVTPKCSEHASKRDWETVALRWRTRARTFHNYILNTPHVLSAVLRKMSSDSEASSPNGSET